MCRGLKKVGLSFWGHLPWRLRESVTLRRQTKMKRTMMEMNGGVTNGMVAVVDTFGEEEEEGGEVMTRLRAMGMEMSPVGMGAEVVGDTGDERRVARLSQGLEEWVRQHLTVRAERAGGLTQGNVREVLASTTLRRRVKMEVGDGVSQQAGHVVWAWVAERERKRMEQGLQAEGVERMLPNGGTMPGWRETSTTMSGYGDGQRLTMGEVQELRQVEMVYRALRRQMVGGVEAGEEEGGEGGALWVEVWQQQAAWDTVKKARGFEGVGGRERFWRCLAILMLEGRVEGHPGRGPREGDWWGRAVGMWEKLGLEWAPQPRGSGVVERVGGLGVIEAIMETEEEGWVEQGEGSGVIGAIVDMEEEGVVEEGVELEREGRVVRVCLEWCAGAQSGRRAAEEEGYIYRGVDWREHVYSAAEGGWVTNVAMDVMRGSFVGMWELVRQSVEEELGEGVKVVLGFIMGGPCCITFSKMNRVNEGRGCAYRDRDGEPLEGWYGEQARAGDKAVQRLQGFLRWATRRGEFKGHFRGWMLENPVGDLAGRPYMLQWDLQHVRREVHLCAYGHYYKKPTHIWTSVRGWRPKGERAEGDGYCRGMCGAGREGDKGKWVHVYALGVASQKAKGGRGRKEMKQAIPHGLHLEILRAAG